LRMRIRREKNAAGPELLLKLDLKSLVVIVTRGRRIRAHIDVLRIRLQQISVRNRALAQQSRARRNGSVEGIGHRVEQGASEQIVLVRKLIDIDGVERKMYATRTYITGVQQHAAAELSLKIEVPLLHVRIRLIRKRRLNSLTQQAVEIRLTASRRRYEPVREGVR